MFEKEVLLFYAYLLFILKNNDINTTATMRDRYIFCKYLCQNKLKLFENYLNYHGHSTENIFSRKNMFKVFRVILSRAHFGSEGILIYFPIEFSCGTYSILFLIFYTIILWKKNSIFWAH